MFFLEIEKKLFWVNLYYGCSKNTVRFWSNRTAFFDKTKKVTPAKAIFMEVNHIATGKILVYMVCLKHQWQIWSSV